MERNHSKELNIKKAIELYYSTYIRKHGLDQKQIDKDDPDAALSEEYAVSVVEELEIDWDASPQQFGIELLQMLIDRGEPHLQKDISVLQEMTPIEVEKKYYTKDVAHYLEDKLQAVMQEAKEIARKKMRILTIKGLEPKWLLWKRVFIGSAIIFAVAFVVMLFFPSPGNRVPDSFFSDKAFDVWFIVFIGLGVFMFVASMKYAKYNAELKKARQTPEEKAVEDAKSAAAASGFLSMVFPNIMDKPKAAIANQYSAYIKKHDLWNNVDELKSSVFEPNEFRAALLRMLIHSGEMHLQKELDEVLLGREPMPAIPEEPQQDKEPQETSEEIALQKLDESRRKKDVQVNYLNGVLQEKISELHGRKKYWKEAIENEQDKDRREMYEMQRDAELEGLEIQIQNLRMKMKSI